MNQETLRSLWKKYKKEIIGGAIVLFLFLFLLSLLGLSGNQTSSSLGSSSSQSSSSMSSSSEARVNVTITFDFNGGTGTSGFNTVSGLSGNNLTQEQIPVAVRTGYSLEGYSLVKDSGLALETLTFPNESITLYAVWIPEQYDVRFVALNDGVATFDNVLFASVTVTDSGRLLMTGRNNSGIYGTGNTTNPINQDTPNDITAALNLNTGERVTQAKIGANNGESVIVLTSQGRVLTAGANDTGVIGNNSLVNATTYQDITASFNLNSNEVITEVNINQFNAFAFTNQQRLFGWGRQTPLVFKDVPSGNFYLVPTDLTSNIDNVLNPGEAIRWVKTNNYSGIVETTLNRYLIWGESTGGSLMFQGQFAAYILVPLDITAVLNNHINNEQIVSYATRERTTTFMTATGKVYNFGFSNDIFFPNTTDRTDYAQFWGSSTPLLLNTKLTFNDEEFPMTISAQFFVTNQRRLFRMNNSNTNIVNLQIASNDAVRVLGGILGTYFISSYQGRTFLNNINRTASYLVDETLETLTLDFGSTITYIPNRSGFEYTGWYTDRNLTILFEGTVPNNNDLVLYTRFQEVD